MDLSNYKNRVDVAREEAIVTHNNLEEKRHNLLLRQEEKRQENEQRKILECIDKIIDNLELGAKKGQLVYRIECLPSDDFEYKSPNICSVKKDSLTSKVIKILFEIGITAKPMVYRSENIDDYNVYTSYQYWLEVRFNNNKQDTSV